MKTKLLLLFVIGLTSITLYSQSPESFNYQAVIRDAANEIVSNQNVGIQFRLLQSTPSGTAVYTETHNLNTDAYGLVALEIGTGTTSDDFTTIDWANGPYFLEIAADITGGTSYNILGTQQLMSVPYALYAKTSGSNAPSDKITDADDNTKVEVEKTANDDKIHFTTNGTEHFTMDSGKLGVFNDAQSVYIGEEAGENDDFSNPANVGVGYRALKENSGQNNTATGYGAAQNITSGNYNSIFGATALYSNTTGEGNSAFGGSALFFNQTGSFNTAFGRNALINNTGSSNTALGFEAGHDNTGNANLFLGYKAGYFETGDNKLYIENTDTTTPLIYGEFDNDLIRINGDLDVTGILSGDGSGLTNLPASTTNEITDADNNTKIQVEETANEDKIRFDVAGTERLVLGNNANGLFRMELPNNDGAIIVGLNAGSNLNAGGANTFIGTGAGKDVTVGIENTYLGFNAGLRNSTGKENVMIGYAAGRESAGVGNVFLGYTAGYNETGSNKLFIENSDSSLPLIYGEFDNDLIRINGDLDVTGVLSGDGSGLTNLPASTTNEITDADNNTKIQVEETANDDTIRFDVAGTEQWNMKGARLESLNTGKSIFIGENAGLNDDLSGNANVFMGFESGENNTTGNSNVAIGYQSLQNSTTGNGNVANGYQSLTNNINGAQNTAIGNAALSNNDSGNFNTAMGANALDLNEGGNHNTAIGNNTLNYNIEGDFNTALGDNAGVKFGSGNLSYSTAIGSNARVATSNSLVLGGTGAAAVKVGIGTDSPTELLTLAGTSGTDGILFPDNTLQTTAFTGSVTSNEITDADNNTKIQVEKTANDDIIRFDVAGTEQWNMIGTRLVPVNTGNSIFIGKDAGLNDDLTDNENVFIGYEAGITNSTGNYNIGIGHNALRLNQTGNGNINMGYYTLNSNTSGSSNIAFGSNSQRDNKDGNNNIGVGQGTLTYNINGIGNVALGSLAGASVKGSGNVLLGNRAGENETGSNTLYINNSNSSSPLIYGEFDNDLIRINGDFEVTGVLSGDGSGLTNLPVSSTNEITDADNNTKIQVEETANEDIIRFDVAGTEQMVLQQNANGDGQLVVGATSNVFLGNSDTGQNNTGASNVFVGNSVGSANTTGSANVGVGNQTLLSNTDGTNNSALGDQSLRFNTSGNKNIAMGPSALYNNTTGSYNIGFGSNSGKFNKTGTDNVFIGNAAGQGGGASNNVNRNVIIGSFSGFNNQGDGNVFLGYSSGNNETGSNKLYIENSFSSSPLIYGEFDSDLVRINGDFDVTGVLSGDGSGLTNLPTTTPNQIADADGDTKIQVEKNTNEDIIRFDLAGSERMKLVQNSAGSTRLELSTNTKSLYIGREAGILNTQSIGLNTFLGYLAGQKNTGYQNTIVGAQAGLDSTGSSNVLIGFNAGKTNTGDNNIFIGAGAGQNEIGNNKLFIENSDSSSPLIYGEFDTDLVRVNGDLETNSLDASGTILSARIGINTPANPAVRLQVVGDFILGQSGTTLNNIIKVDVTTNIGNISSDDMLNVDFTVPGAQVGSSVMVSPSGDLPPQVFIGQARVVSANTVRVRFHNESNSGKDPANMTYYITVIK